MLIDSLARERTPNAILALRHGGVVTINGGTARIDKVLHARVARRDQEVQGPGHIGLMTPDGIFQARRHRDEPSLVQNGVDYSAEVLKVHLPGPR